MTRRDCLATFRLLDDIAGADLGIGTPPEARVQFMAALARASADMLTHDLERTTADLHERFVEVLRDEGHSAEVARELADMLTRVLKPPMDQHA